MITSNKSFFSFSVDDIQMAKGFYGQVLGLEVKETPEGLSLHLAQGATVFSITSLITPPQPSPF